MMNDFFEEIKGQPDALKETLNYILNEGKPQFLKIRDFIKKGGITKLIFTGMGSSYIGSYLPYYILNPHGIAVEMREAGEFLFNTFPEKKQDCFNDTGIVIISQSGESGEIRELVRKINEVDNTPLTIGITNNPDSYLSYRTELQIFLNFDKEISVTSKSYVCTLLIFYVMAKTIISDFFHDEREIEKINNLIEVMRNILNSKEEIDKIWKDMLGSFGFDIDFLEILSDGTSMTTAHQAALNFKEIVKSYSEANSISFFRHGGIEILNDQTKLLIITSDAKNSEFNTQFINKIVNEWTCGKIICITNQDLDSQNLLKNPKIILYKHKISDPLLAPIIEIVILQLLFYKIAEKRGVEPGIFKYSTKVTNNFK